jgi:hypothetical protein
MEIFRWLTVQVLTILFAFGQLRSINNYTEYAENLDQIL